MLGFERNDQPLVADLLPSFAQWMEGLGLPSAVQWSARLYSPCTVVTLFRPEMEGGERTVRVSVCSRLWWPLSALHW